MSDTPREEYYADARSWAADRDASAQRSRRAAWIVASLACGVAVLEAFALAALAPLKTVVPYTVMVDKATGYSTVVDGSHPMVLRPDAALAQSLLAQYVIAREGFDITTIARQYNSVGLWSEGEAKRDYLALMPIGNPASPLNLYPRAALVEVTVTGVSLLGGGQAEVRFVTDRRDAPAAAAVRTAYVAHLSYRFAGQPLSADDRLTNPLGFEVAHYRRDQEALAAPAAPATATVIAAPAGAAVPIGPRVR